MLRRWLINHWHWLYCAFAVSCGLWVVYLIHPPQWMTAVKAALQAQVTQVAQPAASSAPAPKADPALALALALARAEARSAEAMEARLAALDAFFAERKRGAEEFAASVLSYEAKARAVAGAAEQGARQFANSLRDVFGTEWLGEYDYFAALCDPFRDYVASQFDALLLSQEELETVTRETLAGYAADLRALDGDAPAVAMDEETLDPVWQEARDAIQEAIDAAVFDLGAGAVQFLIADQIGNAVAAQATPEDAGYLTRKGIGLGADIATGEAITTITEAAGYRPESAVAARAATAVEAIRTQLIDGEPGGLRRRMTQMHAAAASARAQRLAQIH